MYKILMVDDDAKNLKATQSFLKSGGYDVITSTSPNAALELIKQDEFALVLLDYQMPEMMGDLLAAKAREINPNQQIAMYSCDLSREAVKSSMRAGAVDFIEKTLPPDELLKVVESYGNRYETLWRTIRSVTSKSELRALIESVGMVGESQGLAQLAQTIQKVAEASETSVLIRGESGTGKELVARAIHKLSPRSGGPFVAINCGAIPKDLLESELFGHVRGAFTGAVVDKIGKFALAHGGTLFLDEIGDMPPELQVKLLRVLQEREVVPIGAKVAQKINIRVVSATHQNLEKLVADGGFREDLMYRIKVVEVDVPPLRTRTEDIEPLVAYFTDRYNKKNAAKKYFQRRTLDVLARYPWPGNVRELEGVVERHLVVSNETMIRPDDLDVRLYEIAPTTVRGLTFDQFRQMKEKETIRFLESTIKESRGIKAEAARKLEVKPSHLEHLLEGCYKRMGQDASAMEK